MYELDNEVLEEIFNQKEFREEMESEFGEEAVDGLYSYWKEHKEIQPEMDNNFYDFLYNEYMFGADTLLSVAWNYHNGGPVSGGYLKVEGRGNVMRSSSDTEDTWYVGDPEVIQYDYGTDINSDCTEIFSAVISTEELIEFAIEQGLREGTTLKVDGEEIDWKAYQEGKEKGQK